MSGVGITGRKGTPRSYCAHLYYTMKEEMYEWRVYFVITQDLDVMKQAIDAKYGEVADRVGPDQVVMFEGEQITLDIPKEDLVLENGWTITPHTTPGITKQQVDNFVPGGRVPSCQLHVKWTGQQEKPPELVHRVRLLGAKEPNNFFLIRPPTLPASPLQATKQRTQRTEEIAMKGSDYNPAVVPVLSLLQLYHLFVNLRTKALDAAMQLNVKDFQDFLAGLPVFTTVEKHKFFHRRTLYSFTTMTKLFNYLDDFWDYINCDLLQQVVMKIGGGELSDAMEEYYAKLMQMKRETTVQQFAFQVCNQRQLQVVRSEEFFTEVLIRLHARSNEYTLHDAERLRRSFLSTYSLTSYSVAFCDVFEGTIVIKLWLRSECSPVTIQCEKRPKFVFGEHVLQILVDGIPIQFSEVTKIEVNSSPSRPSQVINPLSSSATRTVQQPTLSQLICFKTRADSINVLEQIGSHYWEFGVLLLEDTAGAVTEAIVTKHKCDAKAINLEILRNWLEGKGKKPVEWSTLVKVLNDMRLSKLANEMEQTLQI